MLLLLSIYNVNYKQPETVDIKVIVTNINTLEGNIEMGVFNDSKTFLKKGKEYKAYSQKVTNKTMIFYLSGLEKDNYAISLYHGINSDNRCNLNILGRPSEPYGFSNNVKLKLFKPSFDDCKVVVNKNMTLTIELVD